MSAKLLSPLARVPRVVAASVLVACLAPATWAQQLTSDARAFRAARNAASPALRVTGLRAFLHDFPESDSCDTARQALFETLLAEMPGQLAEIDALARAIVNAATPGYDRWVQQMYVADELAGAGTAGVDLPLAQKLIEDTERQMTEERLAAAVTASYRAADAEPPSSADLHGMYRHRHAQVLTVHAHVLLRQNKLGEAGGLLAEADAINPRNDEVHALQGELALKQQHDGDALRLLEEAQVLGELLPRQHTTLLQLYRAAHEGSADGLEEELDVRYAALYPPPFQPAPRKPTQGDRTVLLELFTGSGCGPCVGTDLAAEALLAAYPRNELIVLSMGEHVPLPDPLANAYTAYRAYSLEVDSTPQYALDGSIAEFDGADRDGAEGLYREIAKAVDEERGRPAAVRLALQLSSGEGGRLHAVASAEVASATALRSEIAAAAAADKDDAAPAPPAPAAEPLQLAVRFALVEDGVRYSGQNGVRFHRMVVRAIRKGTAETAWKPDDGGVATADFDPAKVSRSNAAYLANFEQQNDSFGPVHFLMKDTTMRPDHLAVVAWMEDPVTHRVLQAAFAPVQQAKQGE